VGKHLIFLVHGMGRYGVFEDGAFKPNQKGWFAEAVSALRSSYDTFAKTGIGGGVDFDQRFDVVPILYDDVFEHVRTAWAKQAEAWTQLGLTSGFIGQVRQVLEQKDKDAFLWTHAADVAFYAIPIVRENVKLAVVDQMLAELSKRISAGPFDSWTIIGHSLGTAVVHDSMRLLQHRAIETFQQWLPPRGVCMIANVARALSDKDATAYDEVMAPTDPTWERPGYYLNINHALDPFTRIDPFAPTTGGWVAPGSRYRNLSGLKDFLLTKEVIDWAEDRTDMDKFAALVPHGFTHYLRQPRVVSNLWCALLAKNVQIYGHGIETAVSGANQHVLRKDMGDFLEGELAHLLPQADAVKEKTIGAFLAILQGLGGL